jgi:hypothetical protein
VTEPVNELPHSSPGGRRGIGVALLCDPAVLELSALPLFGGLVQVDERVLADEHGVSPQVLRPE